MYKSISKFMDKLKMEFLKKKKESKTNNGMEDTCKHTSNNLAHIINMCKLILFYIVNDLLNIITRILLVAIACFIEKKMFFFFEFPKKDFFLSEMNK